MAPQTAVCSVHGKTRNLDCLVETGAGWVCSSGSQCRGAKTTICKFFQEGKCTKGEACTFLHEEGEVAPAQAPSSYGPAGKGKEKGKDKGKDKGSQKGPYGKPSKGSDGKGYGKYQDSWDMGAWGWDWGYDWGKGFGDYGKGYGKEWGGGGGKDWGGKDWGKGWDYGKGKDGYGKGKGYGPDFGGKGGKDYGGKGYGGKEWSGAKGKGGKDGAKGGKGGERMECALHKKMRIVDALEEYPDGSWVCKSGSECQVLSDGLKRSMCKFFLQDGCTKGEACQFAHSEAEIGTPIPELPEGETGRVNPEEQAVCSVHGKKRIMAALEDDGSGGMACKPGFECKDGTPARREGWGEGGYGYDDHNPHAGTSWGQGKKGSSKGEGPVRNWGHGGGASSSWRSGEAHPNGDRWGGSKHGPAAEQAMCQLHGKMRIMEYLVRDQNDALVCVPESSCQVSGEAGVKRSLCKFYEQGTCTKGENCTFAHGADELGSAIPEAAIVQQHLEMSGEPKHEEKMLCAKHNKMRVAPCLEEDGLGGWVCRPGSECKGTGTIDAKSPPACKFYQQGKCTKGVSCPFSHTDTIEWEGGYGSQSKVKRPIRSSPY